MFVVLVKLNCHLLKLNCCSGTGFLSSPASYVSSVETQFSCLFISEKLWHRKSSIWNLIQAGLANQTTETL